MSKQKDILSLVPPEFIFPQQPTSAGIYVQESFNSPGHLCNYCHGNGWLWGHDDLGERIKKDCPVCAGSGKLDARIIIEWTASKKVGL